MKLVLLFEKRKAIPKNVHVWYFRSQSSEGDRGGDEHTLVLSTSDREVSRTSTWESENKTNINL